jgi:hypothetical protein
LAHQGHRQRRSRRHPFDAILGRIARGGPDIRGLQRGSTRGRIERRHQRRLRPQAQPLGTARTRRP